MRHATQDRWTVRRLLQWTTEFFARKQIDSPRVCAEMLMAHVLGVQRIKLYMDPDRPATEVERAAFRALVERAGKHEPVDYLVGHAPFFSMTLRVGPAVLVPRPSTETLVEHVIQHSRHNPGWHRPLIVDVCTGSGCVAIALAKHLPESRVIAIDVSPQALEIARENAKEQGVAERIEFRQGDMLGPLDPAVEKARYLVSNPPYISDAEWADVPPNVKDYEPALALRGGPDGLSFLRVLLEQGHRYLEDPGQIVLEFAASQDKAIVELARANPAWRDPRVSVDHENLPRMLVADKAPDKGLPAT